MIHSEERLFDFWFVGGFLNSLSVYYSSIYFSGTIMIFDNYDATGNILASVDLDKTPSSPHYDPTSTIDSSFSPFYPVTLNFTGTAYSARFQGKGSNIFFDDVALTLVVGAKPTGVPTSSPTRFNAGQGGSEHTPTPNPAYTGLPAMAPTGYPTIARQPLSPHPKPISSPHEPSTSTMPSSAPISSPHEPSTSTQPSSAISGVPSSAPISSPHEPSTSTPISAPILSPHEPSTSTLPSSAPISSPHEPSTSTLPSSAISGVPSSAPISSPHEPSTSTPVSAPISSPSDAKVSNLPTGLPTFYYVNLSNNGTSIEFIDKDNSTIGALGANGISSAKGGSGVSVGEIAGIAVGGVVVIAGIIAAIFYYTSGSAVANGGEALRRTSDYALNSGIQVGHGPPVNWGQGAEGTSDMFVL